MSTHLPVIFKLYLRHFLLAKLATSSTRVEVPVNMYKLSVFFPCVLFKDVVHVQLGVLRAVRGGSGELRGHSVTTLGQT